MYSSWKLTEILLNSHQVYFINGIILMHYFHRMTGNIKAERFTDSTTIILCRPLVGQILYTASWTMNKTFQNQTKMSFYISKLRTRTQKCLLLHYDLESSPYKCMVRSCYWLQTTICYSANNSLAITFCPYSVVPVIS